MLTICNDTLPNNALSYLAFRVACLDTLERMVLASQFDVDFSDGIGFLTEVPFLRAVPPQVQLDVLSETWHKHSRRERIACDLLDESVIFAACETAARAAQQDASQMRAWVQSGPRQISLSRKRSLDEQLRQLYLSLSNEGDFLLISQFEDLPPFEALSLKAEFGLQPSKCEPMFDVLGRWHVKPGFAGRLTGLLTDREIAHAVMAVKGVCRSGRSPHSPA
jgi:hypothetical protein